MADGISGAWSHEDDVERMKRMGQFVGEKWFHHEILVQGLPPLAEEMPLPKLHIWLSTILPSPNITKDDYLQLRTKASHEKECASENELCRLPSLR